MKVGALFPHKKARIEIIPLIDIMFFLLAAFMLVSLTMINMKGIDVNLPTATSAQPNSKPDFMIVSVDALLDIYSALLNERSVAPLSITTSAARAAGPR